MPATAATPIRLGAVSYLNTLPLIEGLGKLSDLSITLTAPARLIDLLMERAVEVALASVIDAQRAAEPVAILPVGMIGSDGPTLTVRLFSRVPIERITRVHADIESHTSVALLRVLLAERFGLTPTVVDFDPDHPTPEAESILLIGDKVITHPATAALYPHQLDLGEAWRDWTGLPFVYAVWMCRAEDAGSARIRAAAAILDRQRRHNATRLPWIAATRAPARGWPVDVACDYLGEHLTYDLGRRAHDAVRLFFDACARHAILGEVRKIAWIPLVLWRPHAPGASAGAS